MGCWRTRTKVESYVTLLLTCLYLQLFVCMTTSVTAEVLASTEHRVRLYSRCSNKYVQVLSQRVTASGDLNRHSKLIIETSPMGNYFKIKSAPTGDYICFSRSGRLKVKHSGHSRYCHFREEITHDDYTEFHYRYNTNTIQWKLGFKRKGQRLLGSQWRGRQKCFQFIKEPVLHRHRRHKNRPRNRQHT